MTAKRRCVWCLRTDTELRPANRAAGEGAEECVDVDACIDAHQKLVEKLTRRKR